jgi:hypothetical protein
MCVTHYIHVFVTILRIISVNKVVLIMKTRCVSCERSEKDREVLRPSALTHVLLVFSVFKEIKREIRIQLSLLDMVYKCLLPN